MNIEEFMRKSDAATLALSMGVLLDGCTSNTNETTPDIPKQSLLI